MISLRAHIVSLSLQYLYLITTHLGSFSTFLVLVAQMYNEPFLGLIPTMQSSVASNTLLCCKHFAYSPLIVSIFVADPYLLLVYPDAFYSKVFLTFREISMNSTKNRFGLYPGSVVRTLHLRTFLIFRCRRLLYVAAAAAAAAPVVHLVVVTLDGGPSLYVL